MAIFREAPIDEGASHSARIMSAALVAAILIPALMIAGWLAYLYAQSARDQIGQDARNRAEEIAGAIDREIVSTQNLLVVLSSSYALQTGDFEAFHRQASDVARQLNMVVVLRDPVANSQVVNTSVPWGTPTNPFLPDPLLELEQEALRTGKPTVSNVYFGPVSKRHLIRVVTVVPKPGREPYFLSIGLPLSVFGMILERLQTDPNRIGAILDRANVIIARSERHSEFAGTPIRATPRESFESVVRVVSRDGVPFHWFRVRSEVSGWIIAVGVPDSEIEAPVQAAARRFAAGGGALVLIAIGAAFGLGGRMSSTLGSLRSALATARRRGREQFQLLFESVPNGIVALDARGTIVLVNQQVEQTFGYAREELIGQPIEMLLPQRYRKFHESLRGGFLRSPEARPMGAGRELYGRRRDGSEFAVEVGLTPISTSAGNLVMATIIDVSERKKSEAERDELRRRIVQGQEQERLRLAHELHDRTGQELTAAMLELKGIEAQADERGRDRIRVLRQQLDGMGKSLHHIAWELRPASFDELGLASALATYVSDWSERYAIAADFHCRDARVDELPDDVRNTIYRVVQEALTNVAKHAAGAKTVSVVIDRDDTTLRLTVEDDGQGFDVAAKTEAGREQRLGLSGMKERLALVGGQIEIESSPSSGTAIFARIPVTTKKAVA